MKFRRFAAALLMAALCLSVCLPAGFAAGYAVTLRLGVEVRCTGTSIPAETFQLELTAQDDEPMPADVAPGDTVVILAANHGREPVTAYFPEITFTHPGYYYYTVKQVSGSNANADYDETVYYLKIQVVNDGDALRTDVMAFTSPEMPADQKQSEISFINRYGGEKPEIPPYHPPIIIPIIIPVKPVTPATPPSPETPAETPTVTPEEPPTETATTEPEPTPAETIPLAQEIPVERLIQTGQNNWPIPVLTGGGASLIGFGILLTRREKRKDKNA